MTFTAFSALVIKSVDEEQRIIKGIATTPTLDRVKDSVKPEGMTYAKSIPLLLQHDHSKPVGSATLGKATPQGIPFEAQIAKVDEPGEVKTRTDEAWHSVKTGLIKGTSIGFKPHEYEPNKQGGMDFTKAEIHELSLVTIPCNPEAVITAFKALSAASEEVAQATSEVSGEETQNAEADAAAAAEAKAQEEAKAAHIKRVRTFLVSL